MLQRPATLLIAALGVTTTFGGEPFADGLRAYEQGRFREAYEAFHSAAQEAGDQAGAELLSNEALAALRAGALDEATAAAERALLAGDAEVAARAAFLLGNVAFTRLERAELAAMEPNATVATVDRAIALALRARDQWQSAAMSRRDWPEARRNVERALLKLASLRARRESASPTPPAPPPEQAPKLLRVLEKKEEEKRSVREQQRQPVSVPRDW